MHGGRFSHPFQAESPRLDEAATPWPLALPSSAPSLVACPVHPATMLAAQDIYRIAYENALASTRTSRYGLATLACPN